MNKSYEEKIEKFFTFISSVNVLSVIFLLIIIASTAGTLFTLEESSKIIYNSFWFQAIFLCLLLAVIYCRLRSLPKNIKEFSTFLVHLSIPVILTGAFIGFVWGDKAYIQLDKSSEVDKAIRTNKTIMTLPFQVLLKDFILEKYKGQPVHTLLFYDKNGTMICSRTFYSEMTFHSDALQENFEILRIIPNIEINDEGKIVSFSNEWNKPAIKLQVQNETIWVFANSSPKKINNLNNISVKYFFEFENAGIKDFKSVVAILEDKRKVIVKTIEVNKPLRYKGYSIYQSGYDETNLNWTVLMVKKNPGIPVVYIGFVILIMGLFFKLYLVSSQQIESKGNEQ
ncbi:MAG: cytochrome c biogenesis protein ResB [Cyanobacteriota bacterium]